MRSVIDVGVQSGTQPLLEVFGDIPHILVEPVGAWRDEVGRSYKGAGIEFTFVEAAASDADGLADLEMINLLPGAIPSHSHIRLGALGRDPNLTYRETATRRVDSLIQELDPPSPLLLKIDVDGADLDVIEGSVGALDRICAIAIETSVKNFPIRVNRLIELGFEPIEIYDLCYYDNRFVQADILFVNSAIVPPEKTRFYKDGFDIALWSEHKPL